jgi:hypothetical protein
MESSNKFICHVRLKRSGAWWYEESSSQMLALRCAKYNRTFNQVFTLYQHQKADSEESPNAPSAYLPCIWGS